MTASALGVAVVASACTSAPASVPTITSTTGPTTTGPTTTAPVATTTPVTVPTPTTTTVAVPPSLQPSATAAASALVSSWASGNRSRALTLATPNAVNVLFARRYPGSLAISRGCTSEFQPIVCTYGPPGGGNSNDPIYQIYASQAPGGWYVSNAVIEQ